MTYTLLNIADDEAGVADALLASKPQLKERWTAMSRARRREAALHHEL